MAERPSGRAGLGPDTELLRLCGAQVCIHGAMTGMRMAVPLLLLSQNSHQSMIGVVLALFALAQVLLLLPAGRFADRHGLKLPITLCVAASTAGLWLSSLWPGLLVLCVAAPLCGAAAGVANLSIQRHLGRAAHSPQEIRRRFSWLAIAPASAHFVGPILTGVALDLGGFRVAFALLGALPLVAWLLVRPTREVLDTEHETRERRPAWELLQGPMVRRLLFMNWLMSMSWDLHAFLVPVLGHERDLPASVIGTIVGSFAVGAALVRLAMPVLGSRLREWVLITGACGTTAALLAVYPFAHSALAMGACSLLLGMAHGSVQPMVTTMLHHVTPRHRHGEAIAMRLVTVNASMVAVPPLLGLVSASLGVSVMFWGLGTLLGLCAPMGARLRDAGSGEGGHGP